MKNNYQDIALLHLNDIKRFFQPCILKYQYCGLGTVSKDENFKINIEEVFILGYVRLNNLGYIEVKILHYDEQTNKTYQHLTIYRYNDISFIYNVKWVNYEDSILFDEENVMLYKDFHFIKKNDLKIKDIIQDNWYEI